MRTTLTLDPDVAQLLEDEVHRRREPLKKIVNDALRRGLGTQPVRARKAYRLEPHEARPSPGFDPANLNRLADELESEAATKKLLRRR